MSLPSCFINGVAMLTLEAFWLRCHFELPVCCDDILTKKLRSASRQKASTALTSRDVRSICEGIYTHFGSTLNKFMFTVEASESL